MEKEAWKEIAKTAYQYKPSDWKGGVHLVFDLGLTALGIFLSMNAFGWFLGQFILFISIWRWFGILHSCVHHTFFRSKFWNEFSGRIASVFAMLPFSSWKWSHLTHHKWTGYRSKDPSLSLPRSEEVSPFARKLMDFSWKWYIPAFTIMIAMKKSNTQETNPKPGGMWIVGAGHIALMLLFKWEYLHIFVMPIILYLITSDIMILSQHNLMVLPVGEGPPIPLHEQDQYTRTLTYPRWITKFVFLSFDKHTLHHLFPYVPHYDILKVVAPIEEIPVLDWVRESKTVPGHQVYLD